MHVARRTEKAVCLLGAGDLMRLMGPEGTIDRR